jgi:type 1 glutamine amidotransferase
MARRATVVLILLTGLFACPRGVPGSARYDTPPLRVCLISGSEEYESDRTLAVFQKHFESHYNARCVLLKAEGTTDLPGLEALDNCDVALLFTRRLTLPADQLDRVRHYIVSGKPLVGVRTASHAFQNWLELDDRIFGGSYKGHYRPDLSQRSTVAPGATDHPVLRGVGTIASRGSLYKSGPISNHCTLLLTSTSPEATEPAAWVRTDNGRRVFYTSLGAQGDFENQSFLRLLSNALLWAAGRDIPPDPPMPRPVLRPRPEGTIELTLRRRRETSPGSGQWQTLTMKKEVPAAEVGVVVCDMWDLHWCRSATERADAIAGRMNPVLESLRQAGVQIVHAPSETMDFYRGTPQLLRAQLAPKATPPLAPPCPPSRPCRSTTPTAAATPTTPSTWPGPARIPRSRLPNSTP